MWRWILLVLPFCIGAGLDSTLPVEIGVLSCTLGQEIGIAPADQNSASEAREILCSFKPSNSSVEETYTGALKSINAAGPIPLKLTILWTVRAPVGTRTAPGLLQQRYAADPAAPAVQVAPLVGERNVEITLQPMSDKEVGSASKERQAAPPYAITAIEIKLNATTT
jgi:hypothetical protein